MTNQAKKHFTISHKRAGRTHWYTAVHTNEDGSTETLKHYDRLSSLKAFIKANGDTFTVTFW
jgi:hypothetical protein